MAALPAGSEAATVYLALADNEDRSQVARGENAGRSLSHVAVVRVLASVGSAGSDPLSKELSVPIGPAAQSGLRIVVFVQEKVSRRIVGAAQEKL